MKTNWFRSFGMTLSALILGGAALVVSGCTGGSSSSSTPAQSQAPEATPTVFVQTERLARPAINEGLISSNVNLNSWNSITPATEAQFFAGTGGAAFGPIATEAVDLLGALGNSEDRINGIVNNMLPDVMRIDTTIPSGYANGATFGAGDVMLTGPRGGRLLLDDVVDITLFVVLPPALTALRTDNVTYVGPNAGGTGHQPLSATFPYLAPSN